MVISCSIDWFESVAYCGPNPHIHSSVHIPIHSTPPQRFTCQHAVLIQVASVSRVFEFAVLAALCMVLAPLELSAGDGTSTEQGFVFDHPFAQGTLKCFLRPDVEMGHGMLWEEQYLLDVIGGTSRSERRKKQKRDKDVWIR